jgi:hypothetical protein
MDTLFLRWFCHTSHARATYLPVVASSSPLKTLLAPLVAAFDALLGVVSDDVRLCLLVTARGHLPASLCRVKHYRIIAGGALGGDATWLHKLAHEEVTIFALPRALRVAFG